MKRLLIALAAAVAVLTASAKVTDAQSFETGFSDFVPSVEDVDESELVAYDNDGPTFDAPYNFANFGSKYLSLDTGDATLWRTNAGDAAYLDMAMQFNPCAESPEVSSGTKISVYLNSNSNLVVQAGDGNSVGTVSNYVTSVELAPGTWARVTIAKNGNDFDLYLNTVKVGTYPSLTGDATILEVGFSGSGKLDTFVARTTDPYGNPPANYVAKVGGADGEYYTTFAGALADGQTTLSAFNYTFSTQNGGAYDAETNPYVIANVENLLALMYGGDKTASYVQTANIDMAGVAPYLGIDNFSGVYDGGNFTISNVTLAVAEYTGIFRTITGTVKNLTVSNMDFPADSTGSFGCAIVGKAEGNALLDNLTAEGVFCGDAPATHNMAGIVALVETTAGNGTVKIENCTNNATVYGYHHRIGGILAYTRNEGNASISNCVNNGSLVWTNNNGNNSGNPGVPRGVAGIVACPEGTGTITIMDCANTVAFTINNATNETLVAKATGDIVGNFYGKSSSGTFVENGGNTYRAAGNLAGAIASTVTVTKCPYAVASTIGNEAYLTTVKASDLAVGNTYVLLTDIAASETPVFTLAAVGDTISFNTNGFNFAGNVAGSSTVAASEATEGSVITFTGVTGVAAVNNVAYATFDEAADAVASAPEGQQFVTLLADASVNFDAAGTTLAVKENAHTLTVTTTGDIAVSSTPDPSTGITTYTSADGVAKCNDKWYATFTAAYDAALAASGNAKMVVKITDDFTPAISATYNHFYSLEFIDARADQTEGLTINLKDAAGTAYMASSRYFFPANATLVLAADFIHANATGIISGGTLEIPEGVTVTINVSPYWAFYKLDGSAGISAIAGTGTILLPNNTFDGSTVSKTMFNNPDRCFPSLLRNNSWQGTLELVGTSDDKVCDLSQVANHGSKIRFNGFTAPTFGDNNSTYAMGIELVDDGLTLTGDYTRNYTFTGSLKGSGSLSVANTKQTSLMFTGDVSGFTGSVTASGTSAAVTFGASTTGSGQRIVVQSGKTATIGAGATWTATNLVLLGELTVNGTLAVNDNCIWGDKGAGVLRYANKDTLPTNAQFASSWNSKCIIACNPGNKRFVLNNFGNANSTLEIAGDNGVFSAFPSTDNTAGTAPSINPAVILTANWTVSDGWAGADKVTTFSKLSGSGNLTVNGTTSATAPICYTITELDSYTGTLGGNRGNFTIGKVNVATQPADGARVVKTAIGANGAINDNVPLFVAGTDTGKTLTYDANGADGAGLYVASAPTPVTPEVTPSTSGTVDCGSAAAATAAADAINAAKATYIKAPAEAELSGEAAAAYANLFTARADGTSAVVELNADGTNALETAATSVVAQVAEDLSTVAATANATTVSVTGAQPGFYYSVVYSADLSTLDASGVEGDRAMAGTDGSVTLPIPAKTENATAGFYRVKVSVQAAD